MDINQPLNQFGLSDNQINAYKTLLSLGSASVYKIAKQSSLPRSTCYEVMESLAKQGIVSTYQKNKIQYYNAEPPDNFLDLLDRKKSDIAAIMPQLQALYGRAEKKPIVRFYEGKEAVGNILNEFLREGSELWSISSSEESTVLGNEFQKYLEERIKKKIPVKLIINESPLAVERKEAGSEEFRQVRILPKEYEHHDLIFIWNNKVAIFTLKKHYSVLVTESETISGFYKMVFRFMWDKLSV